MRREGRVVDERDGIIKMIEDGVYSPAEGWRRLQETWQEMAEDYSAVTTDACRAMIALDRHDQTDFADRL